MSAKNSTLKTLFTSATGAPAPKSLATAWTSPVTVIRNLDDVSYQINVTTSNSTGTFAVEVSNDYKESSPTDSLVASGTWSALNLSGTPTVAAANDVINITLTSPPFNAVRVSYTPTVPGTGTAQVTILARRAGS